MLPPRRHIVLALTGLGALLSIVGCGKAERQDNRAAAGIMTVLGLEYGDYLASHRNAPPADLAQFRAFLESRPNKMTEYRVKTIDTLFTSPRDGQPIKVVCGVKQPVIDPSGYAMAAYEATGVEGRRLVSNVRGGAEEMSAEDFARAFPGLGP